MVTMRLRKDACLFDPPPRYTGKPGRAPQKPKRQSQLPRRITDPARGGYTLVSAHTGATIARLKPLPSSDRFEVRWRRRDAWRPARPFGAVPPFGDALALIADEPAFWI